MNHELEAVVGFGGMAGATGGMFIATSAGFILEFTGSYVILFIIAGTTYLAALALFQIMVPKIKEAEIRMK